jgi:hypothetical protein
LGILPGIFKLKINFELFFGGNILKVEKIWKFPFSLENCKRKNTLKFTIFRIKFTNLEKLILGILPGIFKLKINFELFLAGTF